MRPPTSVFVKIMVVAAVAAAAAVLLVALDPDRGPGAILPKDRGRHQPIHL